MHDWLLVLPQDAVLLIGVQGVEIFTTIVADEEQNGGPIKTTKRVLSRPVHVGSQVGRQLFQLDMHIVVIWKLIVFYDHLPLLWHGLADTMKTMHNSINLRCSVSFMPKFASGLQNLSRKGRPAGIVCHPAWNLHSEPFVFY